MLPLTDQQPPNTFCLRYRNSGVTMMGFDLDALANSVDAHGRLARIVVCDCKGSVPRDAGTSMLVWADGQSGTIGGGTLEYQAVIAARTALMQEGLWLRHHRHVPLGPELGQCCGGSVSLLTEVFSAPELSALRELEGNFIRSLKSGYGPVESAGIGSAMLTEPFKEPAQPLWIYGAGHVGRALVDAMMPLGFDITWVDTNANRFPATISDNIDQLVAAKPGEVVRFAPPNAQHLVVTYSHALDLELSHRILGQPFQFAGLIGSTTKWTRFQRRLAALGHSQERISQIACPIGLPELGKTPAAIAVGVAVALLKNVAQTKKPVADDPEIHCVKEVAV